MLADMGRHCRACLYELNHGGIPMIAAALAGLARVTCNRSLFDVPKRRAKIST